MFLPAIATSFEPAIASLDTLYHEALKIWLGGGWAMIAIAATAIVIFGLGIHIHLELNAKGFRRVSERTWRRWIDEPGERTGKVGRLLDFVTGQGSVQAMTVRFDELRSTELVPFERDLRVMKVCVSAAPLLGLLGTVTGMLSTFGALAAGSGGDKTMSLVAGGISEALITTETGLLIALAGLFFQYNLARKHERYKAFLAHLQTVVTQNMYRSLRHERKAVVA